MLELTELQKNVEELILETPPRPANIVLVVPSGTYRRHGKFANWIERWQALEP
jgi:hypothetical protein